MDKMHEEEDIREADVIIEDIKKLIEREKEEGEDENQDVQDLEDALAAMEKFESDEKAEVTQEEVTPVEKPIVDTGILTGPMSGLKNFLIRKAQMAK